MPSKTEVWIQFGDSAGRLNVGGTFGCELGVTYIHGLTETARLEDDIHSQQFDDQQKEAVQRWISIRMRFE